MRTGAANGIGAAQCTCATLTDPDASRIKPIRTRSRYPAVLFYLSPTPAPRPLPTISCLLLPANFPLRSNLNPSLLFVLARAQIQQSRDNPCSTYFPKKEELRARSGEYATMQMRTPVFVVAVVIVVVCHSRLMRQTIRLGICLT